MGRIGAICVSVLSKLRTGQLLRLRFVVQIGSSLIGFMARMIIINEVNKYEGAVDRDSTSTVYSSFSLRTLLVLHRSAMGCRCLRRRAFGECITMSLSQQRNEKATLRSDTGIMTPQLLRCHREVRDLARHPCYCYEVKGQLGHGIGLGRQFPNQGI